MKEGVPRHAQWRESVDLFWYEELNDFLEITLHDHDVGGKDDYMGRYMITYVTSLDMSFLLRCVQ